MLLLGGSVAGGRSTWSEVGIVIIGVGIRIYW